MWNSSGTGFLRPPCYLANKSLWNCFGDTVRLKGLAHEPPPSLGSCDTHTLRRKPGPRLSLRLIQQSRSVGPWLIGAALTAMNAYGQTSMLSTPQHLLKTDARVFAEWLETARPKPVSAQDQARTLVPLPPKAK